jgi:Ca-activated chloride channel homolog
MSALKQNNSTAFSLRTILLVRLLLAGGVLWGQVGASGQAPNKSGPAKSDARFVTLHVAVINNRGDFVPNIPQTAFTVVEDGVEQTVKDFGAEERTMSMGLIVDRSPSMQGAIAVVGGLTNLLQAAKAQDEMFVVNFTDDPYLDQSFTSDKQKIADALARTTSGGGSALRNAISGAIDYLRSDAKKEARVLVVVTDGDDNASAETTLEQLVGKIRDSGVTICTIAPLKPATPLESRGAKQTLDVLADVSGGFSFYPSDVSEMSGVIQAISQIHNDYFLRYATDSNRNVTSRNIKVTVDGSRGLVRIRKGDQAHPSLSVNTVQ